MVNVYSKSKFLLLSTCFLVLYVFTVKGDGLSPMSRLSDNVISEHLGNKIGFDHEVHGNVTDSSGSPLPGVTVFVKKDKSKGTTTDLNGRYALEVPDQAVLVFSMVGFERQEVPTEGKTKIDISLKYATTSLGETVITAFGEVKKKVDVVGAVTTIKPSELRIPSSNLTAALAGRAAGMIAFQRSGEPGENNANFFVRGVSSFGTGKKEPLILIDGIELGVTALARLSPDDILSFSILKDATATALYGSRAANGVILIETKEGIEGQPKIHFRAETSISMPTKKVKFADPVTYMKLYNEAQLARNPFERERYSKEKIDATAEGVNSLIYPSVDWENMLFKDFAVNDRYGISINGGGKVARYYASGSYSHDNGLLKVNKVNNFNNNIDLKSYTLRANVNINLTKSTKMAIRLNGLFDDYNGPINGGAETYNEVIRSNPVEYPPFFPKDSNHAAVEHIMFGGRSDKAFLNPYADMLKGYRTYNRALMMAQMEFNQDFNFLTKGLKFSAMFNTKRISRFDIIRAYQPFYYEINYYDKRTGDYTINAINPNAGQEFLSFNLDNNQRVQTSTFYLQSRLQYNRLFNDKHQLSALLVYYMRSDIDAKAANLQLSLPHRNLGISGRATYSYNSRYYVEFNFGYNGSEKFSKDKRFGFFPSLGFAWNISNEAFWKPMEHKINNLKLRLTYGQVGNDAIGNPADRFFYLSQVNMNAGNRGFSFGRELNYSKAGVEINRYSNPNVTWETTNKMNLGIDLGLFNSVTINADLYSRKTKNILMNRVIPPIIGLSAPVSANVGETSGKGVDITFKYEKFFSPEVWLQVNGSFTYAASKILIYEEPTYKKEWWKSRVGYPISQQQGYIAERLFVDNKEVENSPEQAFGVKNVAGDIRYKDVNGDGIINSLDMVPLGFPTDPEIIYGAGFSFGYKSFDLSAFFQGSARSSFWVAPKSVEPFVGNKQILKVFADNHFSPAANPNLYSLYPRLSTESQLNNVQPSTWWLYDGAFLRVKQVEVGWTLPNRLAKKIHAEKVRIYLNGSNLLLLSGFKLWDIEMGGNGLGYPLQKIYNLGVSMNF